MLRSYLQQLLNRNGSTIPLDIELESFEIVDKAEIERECPLVEWSRQAPEKDRITIQPRGLKYHIYLPSKVLRDLKNQRFKERASFISMQTKEHLDFFISIIPPGDTRRCLEILGRHAIPKIEQCVLKRWNQIAAMDVENGVVLSAFWLVPLFYDIQTWTAAMPPDPKNYRDRMVRSNSVEDMVVVG
ncbi:hypothetical protein FRC09_004467 [Ceratobasidium sp. 395]|nr:hypothetical protein FRC09_004467 [Ceratobasidium sp. 395]